MKNVVCLHLSIILLLISQFTWGSPKSDCTDQLLRKSLDHSQSLSPFHSNSLRELIRQKYESQLETIISDEGHKFGKGSVFVRTYLPIPERIYRGVGGIQYTPSYVAAVLSGNWQYGVRSVELEKRITQLAGQSPVTQELFDKAAAELARKIEHDISSEQDIANFIALEKWKGIENSPDIKKGASVVFTSGRIETAIAYATLSTRFFHIGKDSLVPMLIYDIDSSDLAYIPFGAGGQWLTPDRTTVLEIQKMESEILIPGEIPVDRIDSIFYGEALVKADLSTTVKKWLHIKRVVKRVGYTKQLQWQVWECKNSLDSNSEILLKIVNSLAELEAYLHSQFPNMALN